MFNEVGVRAGRGACGRGRPEKRQAAHAHDFSRLHGEPGAELAAGELRLQIAARDPFKRLQRGPLLNAPQPLAKGEAELDEGFDRMQRGTADLRSGRPTSLVSL